LIMDARLKGKDKDKLTAALQLGNTRETAANVVRLTDEELLAEIESDPQLERDLRQAEAAAEVQHMRTVHKAAQDEKNWRSSVWWLERRDRQRSAAAKWGLSDVTKAIQAAVKRLLEIILKEVPDLRRRHTILAELLDVSDQTEGGDVKSLTQLASAATPVDAANSSGIAGDERGAEESQ
jgi:hypothetical protein